MKDLKTIVVHVDASPRSAVRLRLARSLARRHGAQATALYAVTPAALEQPFAVMEGAAVAVPLLQQLDEDRRVAARALFDHEQSGQLSVAWVEDCRPPLAPHLSERVLVADLLGLGQHDATDPQQAGVPGDFVPTVLLSSGRPAVVVPHAGEFEGDFRQVLVAWKPTREASRALHAALPLLLQADSIHLAAAPGQLVPEDRLGLGHWLRSHGLWDRLQPHAAPPDEHAGESLLSLACDVGADLLVMGCYGHGRVREFVLGGASRTVLQHMTLPVLMTH
jgi:nucleotide-binding universal stress UspA family protein